ncbi:unnamed protein product, partial [Prorocentrum cordatum]
MRPEDAIEAAADGEDASMLGQRRGPDARPSPRGPLALTVCLALAAAAAAAVRLAARPAGLAPPRLPRPRPLSLAASGCEDLPGAKSGAAWSDGTNGCDAYE